VSFAAEVAARSSTRAAVELANLVRETVAADAAREVLHLRLGVLDPALRRPHHRRLLRDALVATLDAARARIFDLPNGDLVAVARGPTGTLDRAEAALRGALDTGGASNTGGASDRATSLAVRRMRLPEEAAQLLTTAAESLGLEPGEPVGELPGLPGPPVGSAGLAAAEAALAAADLESVTLSQSVCRLDPDAGTTEPLWEDRRIAWPALAALVLPGRDLAAAPGLARRLARAAEARLLAELARPAAQVEWRAVGLPLAPATLEGPAFARFAEALPAGRRAEVTVALRPGDVMADPGVPARIVPGLRARGFRVALDDAAPGLFALLPPARLGVDLIRLRWSPALPGAVPEAVAALLAAAGERVVLVGVDRPAAIAWGWEAGLRLFQGPLVERRRRGA
jgi:hypothetical protein